MSELALSAVDMINNDNCVYLEDEIIQKLLAELDECWEQFMLYRARNDYAGMCFCIGMLAGVSGRIYERNTQIEA